MEVDKWVKEMKCTEEVMDRPTTTKEQKESLIIQLSKNVWVMLNKLVLITGSNIYQKGGTSKKEVITIVKGGGNLNVKGKCSVMDVDDNVSKDSGMDVDDNGSKEKTNTLGTYIRRKMR